VIVLVKTNVFQSRCGEKYMFTYLLVGRFVLGKCLPVVLRLRADLNTKVAGSFFPLRTQLGQLNVTSTLFLHLRVCKTIIKGKRRPLLSKVIRKSVCYASQFSLSLVSRNWGASVIVNTKPKAKLLPKNSHEKTADVLRGRHLSPRQSTSE